MRRAEKRIQNPAEIESILQGACVCRIAMIRNGRPYVVPVNFAVKEKVLYFHSAPSGAKVEALRENPQVCFEIDVPGKVVEGSSACLWGMTYQSVIGDGRIFFIEERSEKIAALDLLMIKYSGRSGHVFSDEALQTVLVMGISVETITGKKSG